MNISSFDNYVRNHLPTNSHPEVQAELQHEVLSALDHFDHAHGDTAEGRLQDLRDRGDRWSAHADTTFWGGIGAIFAVSPVLGGFLAVPGIGPALALGGVVMGFGAPVAAWVMGEHGAQLSTASNRLLPYLAPASTADA